MIVAPACFQRSCDRLAREQEAALLGPLHPLRTGALRDGSTIILRYEWYLRETLQKFWLRVVSFAILALLAAALACVLSPYLPEAHTLQTGSAAGSLLLGILTSSRLAVTTFSLSIAVSTFAAAAGSVTPQATMLLPQDQTTQNVLVTFLGAFLFGLVVVALIRWIGHLMQFGPISDTLNRVERVASDALLRRRENPFLGGRALLDRSAVQGAIISAEQTGYMQHDDMQVLQDCAERLEAVLLLHPLPGSFVSSGAAPVSLSQTLVDDDQVTVLPRVFTIGTQRIFEDDPRFGLNVLTEIASRALSPAVDDPGTAIDILGRHVRILSQWHERADAEVMFDRMFVAPITVWCAIEDTFRPITRNGAALSEVQIRLQKALAALCTTAPPHLRARHSRQSSRHDRAKSRGSKPCGNAGFIARPANSLEIWPPCK
jgi:uncharacterized membrane protein